MMGIKKSVQSASPDLRYPRGCHVLTVLHTAGPSTLPSTEPKKRGRPRKQPPPAPSHEIIDISSPVKPKRKDVPLTTKRRPKLKAKNQSRIQEEVDFTVTEEEDEVSVVRHSQTGSQSSLIPSRKGRNRVQGTFSAESMGNGGDAIQIDDDELPAVTSITTIKRKPNLATAGKPVHSFFSKPKPAAMDIDQLPETSNTSSMPNPFLNSGVQGVSDVRDAQPQNTSATAKPTHNFFSAKSKRAPAQAATPSTPIETVNSFFTPAPKATVGRPGWAQTATTVKEARWPCAEEIEEPSEYVNERPRLTLPKRARQRVGVVPDDEGFWARLLPKSAVDLDAEESVEVAETEMAVIPDEYKGHPAITSLPAKAANGTTTQLWIDKYRPSNHAEVLGNEVPAKYLAEWLAELAIGIHGQVSEEKRHVQRKVIKTRRKQVREDDWIVEDDEPIRDDGEEDDAPVDDAQTAQQTGYPDLSKRLTNSVLLQGPYGSGKTASVYAAAAELGWEVFEVYPGIGKRSGAHLSQLVGDVGKNHMVAKGRPTVPPSPAPELKQNPLLQAFGKSIGTRKPAQSTDHAVDLTDSPGRKAQVEMDFGSVAQPADVRETKPGGPDVRQSLILLEEVDILYEEDKGFWPALVSLIEESKRPVIMTCNGKQNLVHRKCSLTQAATDLSLIPFEELALQTTLLFSPPEPKAAKALLAGIAVAEGEKASIGYLDSVVQGCQLHQLDPVVFSKPLLPSVERWPLGIDLRAAICQLELELSHLGKSRLKTLRTMQTTEGATQGKTRIRKRQDGMDKALQDMLAVSQMTNIISFVDADIARRPSSVIEVSVARPAVVSNAHHRLQLNDPDRYKPSEDDETGIHELLKPLPRLETQVLPVLSQEDEMATTATELAMRGADKKDWLDESLIDGLALAR